MSEFETLGVDEVAALLRAEGETVMQYARRGALPGTRIGKSWVFLREDVIAFLRSHIATDTEARRREAETTHAVAFVVAPAPKSRRREAPDLPALTTVPLKR